MADSQNNISLAVTDGVSPEIAPKLLQIAEVSDRAEKSVGSLKAQLASLSIPGLGSLKSLLQGVKSETTGVAAAQGDLTAQVRSNTASVSANVAAKREQAAAARAAALADRQAAAEAKTYLQQQAAMRDAQLAGFLEAAEAEEALQAKWQAELIMQDQRIAKELELARARELADLKGDIVSRSATSEANSAAAAKAASDEALAKQSVTQADAEMSAASAVLSEQSELEAAAYIQLAEATTAARAAKDNLTSVTKRVESGQVAELDATTLLAAAMLEASSAAEQLTAAKTNLAEVQSYVNAATEVQNRDLVENAAVTEVATAATRQSVSANVSAAAAVGILEGRTLSMNRAAANFMTRILGLGPIMQSAFVVIGAVAMVSVLYQMGEALDKVIVKAMNAARDIAMAFDGLIDPLTKTTDELQLTNDKLDATIAKLEHKPTTNGTAIALDEARVMADKLDDSLERVQKDLSNILKKNQIGFLGSMFTGQAETGDTEKFIETQFNAVEKARDDARALMEKAGTDAKAAHEAAIAGYKLEQDAITKTTAALVDRYNTVKQLAATQKDITIQTPYGPQTTHAQDQTANLTELGKAAHLAVAEGRDLQVTLDNITKEAVVTKLRDQTSGLKTETKAAAAEWKSLEAAFVQFQASVDATGHKPTAEQSLAFLQSQHVSQANANKLAAKELPFENKIASDDFKQSETQRLQDQVSVIGLYSDALKESADMNRILEAARRKNISLSPQEIDTYKALIAQIVENRDYDRDLEAVYRSTHDAADEFGDSMKALNKLHSDGAITVEQYNQGVFSTMRGFNEASDAVKRYRRALDDQKRDQLSLVGTQNQIAAQQELNSLDNALRQKGADAQHPFGYTEAEIAKVNSQMAPIIAKQQQEIQYQQELNKLLNSEADLSEQIATQRKAIAEAVKQGAMSQQAANSKNIGLFSQQNDASLANGTGGSSIKGAIADYAKSFTTMAKGIKDTFSDVFKTIGDGFADSIGRAIAYGKNLGDSLKDVARSAIGELVSGFVKLGIQMLINATLGAALATAATAASAAQATALATAWSVPALAASVATLGGADAIGGAAFAAALATSTSLATTLATVPKLATGTNYVPNDMLAVIHKGEAVVPERYNPAANSAPSGRGGDIKVEVHNHNGSRVEARRIDENTIRLIVRDEVPGLIGEHAPKVIAGELSNPNSRVSKSVTRNTTASRKR